MWLQGPGFFNTTIVATIIGFAESFAEWCVLLLKGDGMESSTAVVDSSLVGRTLTANGNVNIDVSRTRFGTGALEFDGTGDYLSIANHADFSFGTGPFTVECWARYTSVAGQQCLVTTYQDPTNGWAVQSIAGVIGVNLSGDGFDITGSTTLAVNNWYHIAVSGASGSVKLFINGVQEGSTYTGAVALNSTDPLIIGATDGTAYFNGYIDGLRILKGVAAYTTAFTPPKRQHTEPVDAYYGNVVLLLRGEGTDASTTFTDESPITKGNATVVGNAQIDTAQFKFGSSSMLFDGTGDNIYFADSPSFDLLTNDWTMEGWVRFNALPAVDGDHYICGQYHTATGASSMTAYLAVNRTSGVIRWAPRCNTAVGNITGLTSTPATGTWYHVAFTRNGSSVRFFVNGVQEGSTLSSAASIPASVGPFSIGQLGDYNAGYFNGWIDNFRFTVGVARYTAAFTPPLFSFPVVGPLEPDPYYHLVKLQLNCNGANASTTFTDTSPIARPVTVAGNAQIDTAQSRFGGASALFDGTGDYVNTPVVAADFGVGTGDFTIEMWIRPVAVAASQTLFFYGNDGNYFNALSVELAPSAVSGAIGCVLYDGSATDACNSATGAVAAGIWTHVAAARVSGFLRVFANGVLVASVVNSRNQGTPATTPQVEIGCRYGPTFRAGYYNGWIDDFRFTRGVGRYTANFTPPTREFGTVQGDAFPDNTILLIKGESGDMSQVIKDYSKDFRTITVAGVNPPVVMPTVRKFGTGSIFFDGTGSNIAGAVQPALTIPTVDVHGTTGDFTIEFWINMSKGGEGQVLVDSRPASTQGLYPTLYLNSSNVLMYYTNSADRITGVAPVLGVWTHVALCKASGTTRLFINGAQVGSNYTDGNTYVSSTMTVGRSGWTTTINGFNGYMDQIRVTNAARYTAAFTPLTRPFQDYSLSDIPDVTLLTPKDAFENHTVLLLRGDGTEASTTVTDESYAARTITATGNAQIDTSRLRFGTGAIEFDGTGDYLTAPDSTDWDFTTGLSIETWAYITAFDTSGVLLVSQESGGAAGGFEFLVSNTGVLTFKTSDSVTQVSSAASAVATGVWTHLCVTWDGKTYRAFKDGILLASAASTTAPAAVSGLLRIGNYVTNGDYDMTGFLDNLRIVNGVAIHTSRFTPPMRALPSVDDPYYGNVVLLLRGEGTDASTTFTDESPVPKTGTAGGNAQIDTAQFKMGSASMLFDGTGDYVEFADSPDFALGASDFTIECWIRLNAIGVLQLISGQVDSGGTATNSGHTLYVTTTNKVQFYCYTTSTLMPGGVSLDGITTVATGTWYHVAVTRSSNVWRLFINGVQEASGFDGGTVNNSTAKLAVGRLGEYTSNTFNGWIDNYRITKGVGRYTSNFVPPLLSLPVQGSPEPDPFYHLVKLQLNCNGSDASTTFTDTSPLAQTVTANGNAQLDTAKVRFGSASALFDGTGDYLSLPTGSVWDWTTQDFCVECWVYVNTYVGATSRIFQTRDGDTYGSIYMTMDSGGNMACGASSNGTSFDIIGATGIGTIPTGVWTHVAFTRSGTTFAGFLNGVRTYLGASAASLYYNAAAVPVIGGQSSPSRSLNGWIDDFRITVGAARYTASFTPPAREFGVIQGDAYADQVVLLLKGEGVDASTIAKDYSRFNRAITVNGNAQIDTAQFKYGLGSWLFDGTGDYLDMPDSPDFSLGASDFTIECWVRFNAVPASAMYICGQIDAAATGANASFIIYKDSGNKLAGIIYNSSTPIVSTGTTTVTTGTWYHLAYARSGSNLRLFVNGALEATTSSALSANDSIYKLSVGRWGEYTTDALNGWIDDLRITKGVARYTAAFTPLTKEFPEY